MVLIISPDEKANARAHIEYVTLAIEMHDDYFCVLKDRLVNIESSTQIPLKYLADIVNGHLRCMKGWA